MKIIDFLKTKDAIRIVCESRWMVWNDISKLWEVREKKPRNKIVQLILETKDEEKAVDILKKGG